LELGVNGYVQNEPDGSVTLHAEGEASAVDALIEWCKRGPEAAEVTGLHSEPASHGGHAGFVIRK
jgi:acylphosphatase